jgi:hypothetical protein
MAIFEGLAGLRVRPNAEPTYPQPVCKQELKQCPAVQNSDQPPYVLKCDACDKIVGEWIMQTAMTMNCWHGLKLMLPNISLNWRCEERPVWLALH